MPTRPLGVRERRCEGVSGSGTQCGGLTPRSEEQIQGKGCLLSAHHKRETMAREKTVCHCQFQERGHAPWQGCLGLHQGWSGGGAEGETWVGAGTMVYTRGVSWFTPEGMDEAGRAGLGPAGLHGFHGFHGLGGGGDTFVVGDPAWGGMRACGRWPGE